MSTDAPQAAYSSIIDNTGENTLQAAIAGIAAGGRSLDIAAAYFSLDALALVGESLAGCQRLRILYGDSASPTQRASLLQRIRDVSGPALALARMTDPHMDSLRAVDRLFERKAVTARCYTKQKFHAKAYLSGLSTVVGPYHSLGIIGSGNFSAPGLCKNLELNVHLSPEQTGQLIGWFEERWAEAEADDITDDLKKEIRRQIRLYDPYAIYQRALLLWGDWVQGREPLPDLAMLKTLDPHQLDAYQQALKILARERGVMVCDGVGLGKSYVALALMEHYLARGKRVFLVAPKAILDSSWEAYLSDYLDRYRRGYSSLAHKAMTWFGYDPEEKPNDTAIGGKMAELDQYARQADVVVIDESHNLRKTDSNRYGNLLKMLTEAANGSKTVILLTATPINTEYRDLAAQFRLITQDKGHLAGVRIDQYMKESATMDRMARSEPDQLPDDRALQLDAGADSVLSRGLRAVMIQRSRSTCRRIGRAHGKVLRFPAREPIRTIAYALSDPYQELIRFAQGQFEELASFLKSYRDEAREAGAEEGRTARNGQRRRVHVKLPEHGLRLSAYLPDRYRLEPGQSGREAHVESFLVSLVFVNVMKQLESSPHAFQSILQTLGAGLCARLSYLSEQPASEGDDAPRVLDPTRVRSVIEAHSHWIGRDLNGEPDPEADDTDPSSSEADGVETDAWLARAISRNSVRKGLAGFGPGTHDVKGWQKHIETDLYVLRHIHERTVTARNNSTDEKLRVVIQEIRRQREQGRKALVFTQSRRTAEYLEDKLGDAFTGEVERIDAGIKGDPRARILHAFSPEYNPPAKPGGAHPREVNILVSTDVLAEGVNLQEAGCIVNYDIHWNPVRLIQRIGRVDRRLKEGSPDHSFAILNVVPPDAIEKIISLVDTVEGRTRKISSVLGLDQAFFSATDDEGTLKEFNAQLDGSISERDEALTAYDELVQQHPRDLAAAEAVPAGAFGVWEGAPEDGLFAAFVFRADPDQLSEADRDRYRAVLDLPVLAFRRADGTVTTEPAHILRTLAQTTPGEASGRSGDPAEMRRHLAELRNAVRQSQTETRPPAYIKPELECWMVLRRTPDAASTDAGETRS